MKTKNFQEFILELCQYWKNFDCLLSQPYDLHMGAGTFHPHTFLKGLGPEPWRCAYVQPCRRPVDGRYGKSPYRFQHYYQLQVLLKPAPSNIIDLFLNSLEHIGIKLKENDIGLLEDDWKGPTLGAWGLGWEVRANGQEVTQFTYFQQLGGMDVDVVCGEITYGLERLYMYTYGYKDALDIPFNDHFTYRDIYFQNEFEFSYFNFLEANTDELFRQFEKCEEFVERLCEKKLILPAYDYVLQASHSFNLLDARGAISSTERQRFIGRVRDLAKKCAFMYKTERENIGFPLLHKLESDPRIPLLLKNSEPTIQQKQQLGNYSPKNSNRILTDILFELGVEEMPPSFQLNAQKEMEEKIQEFLSFKKNQFKNYPEFIDLLNKLKIRFEISSRRMSLSWKDIPEWEPEFIQELWGPAKKIAQNENGDWSQAAIGFCKKNSIPIENIILKQKNDGEFIYFIKKNDPINFPYLLADNFKNWVIHLNILLKMKWLSKEISPPFIRPVRWIVSLVENEVLPLSLFGLNASHYTCGQRILNSDFVSINHAKEYEKILQKNHVIFSFQERKEKILTDISELLKNEPHFEIIEDNDLLNKCIGLFESPFVFLGKFDEKYLRLPKKLIQSVLREHMNYFSLLNSNTGEMLPCYIGVANFKCSELENMIQGTQTVVVGRLEDGAFYYDGDLKTSLQDLRALLKNQIFQEGMGTLYDKTERLVQIVQELNKIPNYFSQEDFEIIETACCFSKSDLRSGCVQEFPDEMQGLMGGILAKNQNICHDFKKSQDVADAISQHYLPAGLNSNYPITKHALFVSLLDKWDSICLMISTGVEIKSNKDPFGLRRLALSILRILGLKKDENSLNISLVELKNIWKIVAQKNQINVPENFDEKLMNFLIDRMKFVLKEHYETNFVDALTRYYPIHSISNGLQFLHTLQQFFKEESHFQFSNTFIPYRRALNLTKNITAEKKIIAGLFVHESENKLYEKIIASEILIKNQLNEGKFSDYLHTLSDLEAPLSNFFESVMINDENINIKENRQQLLLKVRSLYESVADFSIIQGQ